MRVEPPTSTISSMSLFDFPASSSAFFTGPSVFLKRSWLSSSKRARVSGSLRSMPSASDSISTRTCAHGLQRRASMAPKPLPPHSGSPIACAHRQAAAGAAPARQAWRTWCWLDSARLARSASRRSFCFARALSEMSTEYLRLMSLMKYSITRWSKSSPPRCVSPFVDSTSKTPWSIASTDTSKVPARNAASVGVLSSGHAPWECRRAELASMRALLHSAPHRRRGRRRGLSSRRLSDRGRTRSPPPSAR